MKILNKILLLSTILIASHNTNAQVRTVSRPSLFNNLSVKIPTAVSELNKAFLATEGSTIQFNFADKFSFSGTVFSSIQRYSNLSSVIISIPSLHNSLLSVSKRINDDNTITY